ncbi:MAG: sulfate permease [Lachnospiraceae bacterium]|nr:sulfate permease [Lachnospiraceae bacterium]
MKELKPKLFSVMKDYTKEQFVKDVISGIIVAIIALPLSIALAIASGVSPEQGLYTAIFAGFFISLLGGSRVQIGGPTAAFVVIVYGIVSDYGVDGLITATIMAGIIMIIFGLLRFGSLIKYIPYTITVGFTLGIAVGIFVGQWKDFLGLSMGSVPSQFIAKLQAYAAAITTIHVPTLLIGLFALLIQIVWPKVTDKIPGSLVAIIVTTLLVQLLHIDVSTVGTLRGGGTNYVINSAFPTFSLPNISFGLVQKLISPAFTIAILASIESLLSCVVSDGMIGSKHKSNAELIGQGVGNIASGLFGGIPATGAIARTAANVKNGGRTPIAGMVHSLTLLGILLVLMPYAAMIPMSALAAVLIMVAYNMSGWREFVKLLKKAPKSDNIVMLLTFFLTVFFDLVVAIEIGMVVAALLFLRRMSEVTHIEGWKYIDDETENDNDPEHIKLKVVPKDTLVYEISGPMFFAAADAFMDIAPTKDTKKVILRMRSVPAIDVSAMHSLVAVYEQCKKKGITLVFSHVQEQPYHAMEKAGLIEKVGKEHFCKNIDAALLHVQEF